MEEWSYEDRNYARLCRDDEPTEKEEKLNSEFAIIKNADDYIDYVMDYKGHKICFVNCEDWLKQREVGIGVNGWYVPERLLADCELYVNKYETRNGTYYTGIALYNPLETYLQQFDDLTQCLMWLIDDEGD